MLPGPGDDAIIDLADITVTHSSGSHSINSLSISNGTFTLSGGTLSVATTVGGDSTFNLSGGTLGNATVASGTSIRGTFDGGTLDGVTFVGDLDLASINIANATVVNGLTLHGTAYLGSADGSTGGRLFFQGTQTLDGPGSVVFGANGNNTLFITGGPGAVLTLGPSITVQGSNGTLGNVGATLVNQGTIQPGTSAATGTLTINGDYIQTETGVLNLRIGGPNPGSDFDRLIINGVATLDGTLNVTLINGYTPDPGTSFQVLTYGAGSSGTFADLSGDGFLFTADYGDLGVALVKK